MTLPWRSIVVLAIVLVSSKITVWGQDPIAEEASEPPATTPEEKPATTEPAETEPVPGESSALEDNTKFISFETGVDDIDIFRYGKQEYLIISDKRASAQAYLTCNKYNAVLAHIETKKLANFIAEALSETRLELDTLWIAGKRDPSKTESWLWQKSGRTVPLTAALEEITLKEDKLKVSADNRNCLGFGRSHHDQPQLRPLSCKSRRTMICQRARGHGGRNNATHPGWIKIGERLYKIYADKVDYDTAERQCPMNDQDSALAVVVNYEDAQQLGRYLLIGRPSLENAWIGARWAGDAYSFDQESINLNYETNVNTRYPPWRNNKMKKKGGCLLLDRHLSNITLFVEAPCTRERAVICYKMLKNETEGTNHTDVTIGDAGYRLIWDPKLIWEQARQFCLHKYGKWGSHLVEIKNSVTSQNLLYVMGENKTAVHHIWLGGHFNGSDWFWVNKNEKIVSTLNWVRNATYDDIVEGPNRCLNMDRENHVVALHYGAACNFAQPFVCEFNGAKLKELQEAEAASRSGFVTPASENQII